MKKHVFLILLSLSSVASAAITFNCPLPESKRVLITMSLSSEQRQGWATIKMYDGDNKLIGKTNDYSEQNSLSSWKLPDSSIPSIVTGYRLPYKDQNCKAQAMTLRGKHRIANMVNCGGHYTVLITDNAAELLAPYDVPKENYFFSKIPKVLKCFPDLF